MPAEPYGCARPARTPRCDTATTQVTDSTVVPHRDRTQQTTTDPEGRKRGRSAYQTDWAGIYRKENR
jgi:hypothetical protein